MLVVWVMQVVYQMKGPNAEEENSAVEVHLQVGARVCLIACLIPTKHPV